MKNKIFNIIQNVLFILSIMICIFVLSQKFILKENGFFGYRSFVIVTNSMSPYIDIGDVILVKKVDYNEIKMGDIITYNGLQGDFKGKIVTHLVKTIEEGEDGERLFYTKGAVSNLIDPVVHEEQIIGKKIYKFVVISFLSKLIRSNIGFILLILIPLILILVTQVINIAKETKQNDDKLEDNKKVSIKKSTSKKAISKKKTTVNKIDNDQNKNNSKKKMLQKNDKIKQ